MNNLKEKKFRSIKTNMIKGSCMLTAFSLSIIGVIVATLMYTSSMTSLEKTMAQIATVSADLVKEHLEVYKTVVKQIGLIRELSAPDVSVEEKTSSLENSKSQYGFLAGNIADVNGEGVLYPVNIADRDYFKAAMNGQTTVSNVLLSKSLNRYVLIVASPVWENGRADTTIVGVVYFNIDVEVLTNITRQVTVGSTGGAYMLDKDNYTIAHNNIQLVLDRDNTVESFKTDPELKALWEIESKMTAGESGFGTYSYNGGVKKIVAYAPVDSGQGWSFAVTAEQSEFMESTIISIIITIVLILISTIIGFIVSAMLAGSITKPITSIEKAALKMAKGDYDIDISYDSNNEIGSLANSMRLMTQTTKSVVLDVSKGLGEIADGNFDIRCNAEYIGVFKEIEDAMIKIITRLSDTMLQVKISTDQVSSGSDQVSNGAQALAQGATEQAGSIQLLSTSIKDIADKMNSNADNSKKLSSIAGLAGAGLGENNAQMSELMLAMSEINNSSSQISKIIKTIEDIAFQTNILALNAAVEAARAGSTGKGFAVVADEVRNLANKSSDAAKQTNILIESSVESVTRGVKIADDTAKSLVLVVSGASQMTKLISEISEAIIEQSLAISHVNLGLSQISDVVQTNSATSEESAAASEELNSQANMIKSMIDKFKLLQ